MSTPAPLPLSRHAHAGDRTRLVDELDVIELRRTWPLWTVTHSRHGVVVAHRWPFLTHAGALAAFDELAAQVAADRAYSRAVARLATTLDAHGIRGQLRDSVHQLAARTRLDDEQAQL